MESIGSGKRILDLVSDRIIQVTSVRTVLASLAGLLVMLYTANGRPFGVAQQLKDITGGVSILDMEFLYTPEQAYALLSATGEAWRSFNLARIVPLDMLLPFFYSLFFAVAITWLLHRWLPAQSRWHRLNVVPLVCGIGDYCEISGSSPYSSHGRRSCRISHASRWLWDLSRLSLAPLPSLLFSGRSSAGRQQVLKGHTGRMLA